MQAHVADLEAVRNRLRDIGRPTSTEMMLAPPGVPYHGSVTHGNLPANPDVPAHLMAAATMSPGYSSARPLPGSMNSSVPSGLMDQAYSRRQEPLPEPHPEMQSPQGSRAEGASPKGLRIMAQNDLVSHLEQLAGVKRPTGGPKGSDGATLVDRLRAIGGEHAPGAMQQRMAVEKDRRQGLLAKNIDARNNPTMAALERISQIGGQGGGMGGAGGMNPLALAAAVGPEGAVHIMNAQGQNDYYRALAQQHADTLALQRQALIGQRPPGIAGHVQAVNAAGGFHKMPPEQQQAILVDILGRYGNRPEQAAGELAQIGLTPQDVKAMGAGTAGRPGMPGRPGAGGITLPKPEPGFWGGLGSMIGGVMSIPAIIAMEQAANGQR